MAIYHCSIKIIGRSDGKSVVASSAYRSGKKLMDARTGLIHDFTKKIGQTTYKVNVFFAENTTATFEDKLLHLMANDIANRKQSNCYTKQLFLG